jgi:hypothetical protein
MQRFQYLKGINGDDKFLGMKNMFDNLKYQKNSPTKMFSPIEDIMDIFYISLLIGIKYNAKINFNDSVYLKGDMTSNWTKGLAQTKDHLIALYVSHIIEDKDKNYSNKPEIQKILNIKLGKDPTRSISDEGMIDIHCYAFGGYIELLKKFDNKLPNDLLTFFSTINNFIKDQ